MAKPAGTGMPAGFAMVSVIRTSQSDWRARGAAL